MSIAIVVLQTGERVITDLQEVRENDAEDGKPICLLMVRPYTLNLEKTVGEPSAQEVQVRFSKWLPYSSDTQFRVSFSSVLAVGSADTGLIEAYSQTVEQAIAVESTASQTSVEQLSAETSVVSADDQNSEV